MALEISSPAFDNEQDIPTQYTCDGMDISPPLEFGGVPDGTKSLALIMDDPDAPSGTFVHWVVYNLNPDTGSLPETLPPDENVGSGGKQGINDFEKFGYKGPCPPDGTHRYFFKLYALDTDFGLEGKVTKEQLLKEMQDHIIGEAQMMGKYERKQ